MTPEPSVRMPLSGIVAGAALVSAADYALVAPYSWRLLNGGTKRYARATVNGTPVLMHRFLLGATDPLVVVDHRDGDGLNNVRSNLRIATLSQNRWNATSRSVSGFRGVSKAGKWWIAKWRTGGEYRYAGCWPTAIEAALAYNDAIRPDRGERAELNEIPKVEATEILLDRLQEKRAEVERIERWLMEIG